MCLCAQLCGAGREYTIRVCAGLPTIPGTNTCSPAAMSSPVALSPPGSLPVTHSPLSASVQLSPRYHLSSSSAQGTGGTTAARDHPQRKRKARRQFDPDDPHGGGGGAAAAGNDVDDDGETRPPSRRRVILHRDLIHTPQKQNDEKQPAQDLGAGLLEQYGPAVKTDHITLSAAEVAGIRSLCSSRTVPHDNEPDAVKACLSGA